VDNVGREKWRAMVELDHMELGWSFENFGTNSIRGKEMLSRAAMILKSRLRVICWMHSREGTRDFAALLRKFLRY
jgi:hypothetical protein